MVNNSKPRGYWKAICSNQKCYYDKTDNTRRGNVVDVRCTLDMDILYNNL